MPPATSISEASVTTCDLHQRAVVTDACTCARVPSADLLISLRVLLSPTSFRSPHHLHRRAASIEVITLRSTLHRPRSSRRDARCESVLLRCTLLRRRSSPARCIDGGCYRRLHRLTSSRYDARGFDGAHSLHLPSLFALSALWCASAAAARVVRLLLPLEWCVC